MGRITAITLFLFTVLGAPASHATTFTWTTLDYPGATHTKLFGIDGANIVGAYWQGSGWHGTLYDGSSWTTLDNPGATQRELYGIDGANMVGTYQDGSDNWHNALYDGSSWTTLDNPIADTTLRGIDGANMVGTYTIVNENTDPFGYPSFISHGALYNGLGSWTTLDNPIATNTSLWGIDGANIVGGYHDGSYNWHGTLYDGSTWLTIDNPSAISTQIYDIDAADMVGMYLDGSGWHGTLYDGSTWHTLDYPGARSTTPYGVDGANVVGWYLDGNGKPHGFMVTATSPVPEPAALLLALFGLALLPRRRRR